MPVSVQDIYSPFKFLDPYRREDGNIFFGRDEEVEQLYQYVNKNRLVLVYGQSGTGKTSLIQCGLANRFEVTDWVPFFVRRGKDINLSLRQALSQSKALGGTPVTDANLLTALERISTRYVRPVYLIFDQFEELLILGNRDDPREIEKFTTTIQQILAAAEAQSVNLLFILREEYFAWLDVFERAIPEFTSRRLRVEPMRRDRLREVIMESCATFNVRLAEGPDNADQIIRNLSYKDREEEAAEVTTREERQLLYKGGVQLPYLQVYLDRLWREDYVRTYPAGWEGAGNPPLEFTTGEISAFGRIKDVLDRFLSERIAVLQAELATDFPGMAADTVQQILDAFATEEGTKRPIGYRQEGQWITLTANAPDFLRQLPPALLTTVLRDLEKSRILRADDDTYELAHDSLAALIDRRRSDEQRRRNRLRRLVRSNYELGQPLTAAHLAELGEEVEKLGLEPAQRSFVAESRRQRDAEREAELAQERRRRRTAYLIAVAGVLLATVAGWQWWEAGAAQTEAERLAQVAQDSAAVAQTQRQEAIRLTEVAETSAADAAIQRDSAQMALQVAERERLRADAQATVANRALADVQRASAQIVDNILAAAAEDIRLLDYPAALQKMYDARNLRVSAKNAAVADALLEVAYFYAETGRYARARNVLDTVALTAGRSRVGSIAGPDSLRWLWDQLSSLNTDRLAALEKRYYPEMVAVAGGSFEMGCKEGRDPNCGSDEKPLHPVRLDDFRIAKTETTVWQYYLFTEATGRELSEVPSWRWNGDHPIVRVSWFDAVAYANWVSRRRGEQPVYRLETVPPDPNELYEQAIAWSEVPDWSATGYRLPTEAEWEYAARGGQKSRGYPFAGSDDIDAVAWYGENSGNRTHPVQTKRGNELGLKHMSGNVWEWVWDGYGEYPADAQTNPRGPEDGPSRVLRGGSWYDLDGDSRVAVRIYFSPSNRVSYFGFRLAQGFTQ